MDGASFERVYDNFQDFHAFFAASFGRKQWREHSRNYLQGLLVQAGERRNAENLSESVGISARAMQRFLTEARWDDAAVIGRLQEYLAPRPGSPRGGVGVGRQRLSQAGTEVGGGSPAVLRQAGEGGQLPGGDVPGLRQPAGTGIGGQGAVSARELDLRPGTGVRAAGVPEERLSYRSKTELALELLERAPGVGPPQGRMGCRGRTPSGCRRPFGRSLAGLGMRYVLDVPGSTPVWPLELAWTSPGSQGVRAPPQAQAQGRAASYHGAAQWRVAG